MRTAMPIRDRHAFTLTELLVVIAVISILSVLTLVSVKAITAGARVASGVNAVSAALENARAVALKRNEIVLVVFRPRLEGEREQYVEVVTARFTGESYPDANGNVVDRFRPAPDVPVRRLPVGVKVACPAYARGLVAAEEGDLVWVTQTHLPAIAGDPQAETHGVMIGVMYGPDGSTLAQNLRSDSDFLWVDFEPSLDSATGAPRVRRDGSDYLPGSNAVANFIELAHPDDETFVTIAPFLAVYDDAEARERKTLSWENSPQGRLNYQQELTGDTGFISGNADRLHFNRYTGVAMR